MIPSTPRRLPALVAALALFGGCGDVGPDPGGLPGEVAAQRQKWEARRPAAYTLVVERQCFCAPDGRGPVRLTVEGTRVVTRTYVDSGEPVAETLAGLFPTVDGLFDILEDALDRSAEQVDVTWDPEWGAPASFFIDYSRSVADEELGFRIVAGPAPSEAGR